MKIANQIRFTTEKLNKNVFLLSSCSKNQIITILSVTKFIALKVSFSSYQNKTTTKKHLEHNILWTSAHVILIKKKTK